MFRLARMSLANRALVALATVAVFVVGVLSMGQLRQELIPSISVPVVAVTAADPGTSPEIVSERVTGPVEGAVQAVEGVTGVTSTVATGFSVTTVELEYGTDVDAVEQEIGSALAGLGLPEGVEPEVVAGSSTTCRSSSSRCPAPATSRSSPTRSTTCWCPSCPASRRCATSPSRAPPSARS
nr:hypothetical protein GCM10025730_07110 [Promicromonospora thailandica]